MRGTTVVWGDYGLRMRDHDRRISAQQLKIAEDTIRKRLRGMKFRMYMRIAANIGVYTSGNDVRMGKGKGSFDRWTARVAVSKIIFEIKGDLHEQVVRDAFRLAGAKLPGEFLLSYPEMNEMEEKERRRLLTGEQDCTSLSRRAMRPSWASRSWRMALPSRISRGRGSCSRLSRRQGGSLLRRTSLQHRCEEVGSV